MTLDRREFLRRAAAQAGALAAGAGTLGALGTAAAEASEPNARPASAPAVLRAAPEIVVIGAGAFGGWTALHLRMLGARVTLVDAYGPGNSRATSGDETRGVRSSYADRLLWVRWAKEAIRRWKEWDEVWARPFRMRLFFTTGDLAFRPEYDAWMTDTRISWDRIGAHYELPSIDDVRREYPVFRLDGMGVAMYEPDAGVVRARRACEVVAEAFRQEGGEVIVARAAPGRRSANRLDELLLEPGQPLRADAYVFACGPWLPKVLPDVMENRLRIPLGHVYYFGTPPGDNRFTYPNLPSFNFPGITGWPCLGVDNRGFRVRTGGRPPEDPDVSQRWIDSSFHEQPRAFLAERFPLMENAPLLETRACHYESSIDRNFIIDKHPGLDNVWIAGGGSAEGFKFGPVVGEYVAKRVLGRETDPELAEAFRLKEGVFEQPQTSQEAQAG